MLSLLQQEPHTSQQDWPVIQSVLKARKRFKETLVAEVPEAVLGVAGSSKSFTVGVGINQRHKYNAGE